ncbi:uncharacterized protein LOC116413225 [Galleria mellonella]|uniref:Uncharacterized protein LOC116413225 n=1 Tax=Galleria mellonella TaxID=7137 RepID=A0A6J3C3K5_GALME|nr:uncharacterized protein LOC116413225 [Galleria mellonella]
MTLEKLLSQMGTGTKHLTDRFTEYSGPIHEQPVYYSYEPASQHGHEASSKHNYGGGGQKNNAAMSALTLLAFLFFLHILQQCIRDHMTDMSTPQIMVMTAGREGETILKKNSMEKIDKTGLMAIKESGQHAHDLNKTNTANVIDTIENNLMKIDTAEPPKTRRKYKGNLSSRDNSNLTVFETTVK